MALSSLVAFDRPLSGAVLRGASRPVYTEAEQNEAVQTAYHRGVDSARAAADQQMVELRADLAALSEGVLKRLSGIEASLLRQISDALPSLAVELSRRLLAGFEPPAEVVSRLCAEALDQLFPERDGLELTVCPRDAGLLKELNPDWLQRYPGLRLQTDATLAPGDCLVRSRFGLTDARQATKLDAVAHSLAVR